MREKIERGEERIIFIKWELSALTEALGAVRRAFQNRFQSRRRLNRMSGRKEGRRERGIDDAELWRNF